MSHLSNLFYEAYHSFFWLFHFLLPDLSDNWWDLVNWYNHFFLTCWKLKQVLCSWAEGNVYCNILGIIRSSIAGYCLVYIFMFLSFVIIQFSSTFVHRFFDFQNFICCLVSFTDIFLKHTLCCVSFSLIWNFMIISLLRTN